MEHTKILKNAWRMLWSYRILWIFGFIFALTSVSGQESLLFSSNNQDVQLPPLRYDKFQGWEWNWPDNYWPNLNELERVIPDFLRIVVPIAIGLAVLIGILMLVVPILRYISETALIRMVDTAESTGEKVGFRAGFRMGWSRTAWRLFLIDLLINLPFALAVLILLGISAIPILLLLDSTEGMLIFGGILSSGLFFLVIFFAIVAWAALSLIRHLAKRACGLDGLGALDAIRHGFALVRKHIRDVGLMWLLLLGIDLGWRLVAIPMVFLGLILGAVLGGGVGLLAGGLTGLAFEDPAKWVVGVLVGLPFFILIVATPVALVEGLKETFISSSWTLTYREIRAMSAVEDSGFKPVPPVDEPKSLPGSQDMLPDAG